MDIDPVTVLRIVRLNVSQHGVCTCSLGRVCRHLTLDVACPRYGSLCKGVTAVTQRRGMSLRLVSVVRLLAAVQLSVMHPFQRCWYPKAKPLTFRQRLGTDNLPVRMYLVVHIADTGDPEVSKVVHVCFECVTKLVSGGPNMLGLELFGNPSIKMVKAWFDNRPEVSVAKTLDVIELGQTCQAQWKSDILINTSMVNVYYSTKFGLDLFLEV